ncbi:MAG: serine/threonine protein kinase [Proteobacteria bacterium]|uniref:serine/threonine-protein kinase n=1 Tax=Rudaea sp. TaxID=2136325 RepID=UPI00378507C4|nr:serine/threonine protein kinase [Pseudomonadota bacterium]
MSQSAGSRISASDQPTVLDIDAAVSGGTQMFAAGQRVGPYRIDRLLGEGGMGAVYLAEQIEPIERPVALKLVRSQLRGGLAEAYFLVERQALARMDHPAIAKVYDAGTTPQGYPFFAMEWIDGLTLAAWYAQHKPPLRELLALFIAICKGVQHAHQKGVIHRDLKPGNVLIASVDGQAAPKIIDFGIAIGAARSNSDAAQAQRAGTRGYMSPEQVSGKAAGIDIRTDIYALGMMLLEFVAPAQLFERVALLDAQPSALHAALRASLGQRVDADAASVRALAAIPSPLRWLLARAIDPQRARRYASAQAMADDLDRYLRHYPLAAVPATRAYRLREFARRNRGAILAAALVAAALIAGTTAASLNMQRARIEAAKSRQISDFLTQVLSGVDPEKARGMDKSLLTLILGDAAKNADAKLARQPEVLADIKGTIGVSYRALSDFKTELDLLRQAYALAASTLGADAELSLDLQRQLARAWSENGDYAAAATNIDKNIAAWTRRQGADGRKTLISNLDRVQYIWYAGDSSKALAEMKTLLPRIERVLGADDPSTIDALNVHAVLLGETGHYAEAEPLFERVLASERRLYGDKAPKTLDTMNDFAVLYLESQRYAQGEKILKQLLPLEIEMYGTDSAVANNVVSNLAGALRQQGTPEKIAESGQYYDRAYAYASRRYGPDHPNTIIAQSNEANYFADTGDVQKAIELDEQALAAIARHGELPQIKGEIDYQLGRLLTRTARYAEAEPLLLSGDAQKASELGANHWRMAEYVGALVDLYTRWGKPEQAAQWRKQRAALPPKPPDAA